MNMKKGIAALVLAAAATFASAKGPDKTAYEWLQADQNYSTFLGLIDMCEMKDDWNNENMTYTIFAPNNVAFERMEAGQLDSIKNDPDKLKTFVKYHMTGTKYGLGDLRSRNMLTMKRRMDGRAAMVSITMDGAFVKLNDARIIDPENWTKGGVIHGIDHVLMPMRW